MSFFNKLNSKFEGLMKDDKPPQADGQRGIPFHPHYIEEKTDTKQDKLKDTNSNNTEDTTAIHHNNKTTAPLHTKLFLHKLPNTALTLHSTQVLLQTSIKVLHLSNTAPTFPQQQYPLSHQHQAFRKGGCPSGIQLEDDGRISICRTIQ